MVTNALARIAFIADRLEKAKLPTAVAAAMSGPNGAALRNHDTAWGMGVGGALVGSTVREVLTSHTVLPADQTALQAAFRALTVAQYAKNFDGYSGQRFAIVGAVETRGVDKLVRTTLATPGGSTEILNYRLRETGGQWKIIDVYYRNAISQLATRRSDFAGVVNKGGAPALIAHLNALAANPK